MLTIRRRPGESVRVGKVKLKHVVRREKHMVEISIPGQEDFCFRIRHGDRTQIILDIVAPPHIKVLRAEIDDE